MSTALFSQIPSCHCKPGVSEAGCGLSQTVFKILDNEKTANGPTSRFGGVAIIRDISKQKRHHFLAVPLTLGTEGKMQIFSDLPSSEQRSVIATAIAAAESASAELGDFGLAQNNYDGPDETRRSQCQIHVHIAGLNKSRDPELLGMPTIFSLDKKGFEEISSKLSGGWLIHVAKGEGLYHFHAIPSDQLAERYLDDLDRP